MRRVLCAVSASLLLGIGTSTVARGKTLFRGNLPATHRLVADAAICATPAVLEQYAFDTNYPESVPCQRLGRDALVRWSGERELALVNGLLSVARVVEVHGRVVGYTLAAGLAPVDNSVIISFRFATSPFGFSVTNPRLDLTGYEDALGSSHFGRNITPMDADRRSESDNRLRKLEAVTASTEGRTFIFGEVEAGKTKMRELLAAGIAREDDTFIFTGVPTR